MKMFCFKFQQNRTINKEFDFLRGNGGQNYTINEEFDYFEGVGERPPGGKRAPIYNFLSRLLLVNK